MSPDFVAILAERLKEKEALIQVLLGPRQVGKTTGVKQFLKTYKKPFYFASADNVNALPQSWLREQWESALSLSKTPLLVVDEIQKIDNWSELVKELWDKKKLPMKCLFLGSSSLSIQRGLSESLTGRFELIRAYHWSWLESKKLLGESLDQYLRFGGYPGSYPLMKDRERWSSYMNASIIDTVVTKDILAFGRVQKPALFRQCFDLASKYGSQEISYTKLLGQLQDRGNTDLVRYYLELFEGAFLIRVLEKYSGNKLRSRSSTPKILTLCPALMSVQYGDSSVSDRAIRGRIFECAVGAQLARLPGSLFYWREGPYEVDFVYQKEDKLYAIAVKTGKLRSNGMQKFLERYSQSKPVWMSEENFKKFSENPAAFLAQQPVD